MAQAEERRRYDTKIRTAHQFSRPIQVNWRSPAPFTKPFLLCPSAVDYDSDQK